MGATTRNNGRNMGQRGQEDRGWLVAHLICVNNQIYIRKRAVPETFNPALPFFPFGLTRVHTPLGPPFFPFTEFIPFALRHTAPPLLPHYISFANNLLSLFSVQYILHTQIPRPKSVTMTVINTRLMISTRARHLPIIPALRDVKAQVAGGNREY
ncbi:hypothetical protein GALMADRAFT_377379 [Galerina marginata CBS 339.88]|uniref:Uncharacterized protein n=1 Tax=Galerina marginata (strain CBS 339.88) TaxID=685588 RepID=A0A067TR52_GALM3|nr:hypothetical protein GALMADRAFT_377379 [Galerina marginata CBS 339.88]